MSETEADRVREALDGLNYPASKDAIVDHVSDRGAGERVQRLVRGLPVAIYGNRGEVLAAVPFDQGKVGEAQDTEDRMNERRHHTHPGLAEHEKQAPQSPIEDVLGDNRGS